MEPLGGSQSPVAFSEFPEDVQMCILSFLRPADIAVFACTSRRFATLCGEERLWFAMCDRRWGSKTLIRCWGGDGGSVRFPLLYKVLDRWENLIGFWRRIGRGDDGTPPLVFFEWGSSFITGSRVSPSSEPGSYDVVKIPFLWMSLSPRGDPVSFVHPSCRLESSGCLKKPASGSGFSDSDLVPVTVCFMGENHFVVDENRGQYAGAHIIDEFGSCDDLTSLEASSPPERLMAEIYQYFANRISPKKRGKDRLGRRRWEAEHFVRISDCYPTPTRPLQGLWKGICENMNLDFYLITYDDVGGIACRKVGDASEPFSGYSPVFWTSNMPFLEHPFSKEEEDIYDGREHIQPLSTNCIGSAGVISRVLYSSGSSVNPKNVEGRVWEYNTGTFGFGFLRNGHIIDLKHIAVNGCLLDTVEPPCNGSCS
ncbi:unnamed protein product [Spirodela intermedia]|uniref:F-box protein n=1 Tax=Spirodela intermedia TaxID=51605 RepID=A0A7I8I7W2_SPIIN|nr:unnamed protein product [Spirodela intermedia]CAA6653558.1 unnamed protein product [Spirodela intermedia]